MQINIRSFCSLSHDASLHSWLHGFDAQLYLDFVHRLRSAKGCTQNAAVMKEVLDIVTQREGGEASLIEYLTKNHPEALGSEHIFENFKLKHATLPRRKVLNSGDLEAFLVDKLEYEVQESEGKVYVEYLCEADRAYVGRVPDENWLIRGFRSSQK